MAVGDIIKAGSNLLKAITGTVDDTYTEAKNGVIDELENVIKNNKKGRRKMSKIIVADKAAPHKEEGVEIVVLEKGANIKIDDAIEGVSCGIEWDEVTTGADFDADVSCLLVKDGAQNELIYHGKLESDCGNILHTGDNLTGADDAVEGVDVEEDDETIMTQLNALDANVQKVIFFVNVYNAAAKKQNFGTSGTMLVRLYDSKTGNIFMEADLMEDNATQTSMIVGEFYRKGDSWKYKNMAQGGKQTISEFANSY